MKATVGKLLLIGCLLGRGASPAAGQTGRIAQLSHGGRAAALLREGDNFGIHPTGVPQPPRKMVVGRVVLEWQGDTLTYQNDSVAVHRGLFRTRYADDSYASEWQRKVEELQYAKNDRLLATPYGTARSLAFLHKWYPNAVLVGFDKSKKAVPKKPASRSQTFPKRPFQYSYWRELASAAGLGAVGWLLGRQPKAKVG